MLEEITPQLLLRAYATGIFPMADSRENDDIFWVEPKSRGVIPLDEFYISRSLRRTLRKAPFEIRCDTSFLDVMLGCAESSHGRTETWINDRILGLYTDLFNLGNAHCVECWRENKLVGGLYGVSLGAAFFGESMFSRETNASKIALCHLVARLKTFGYALLDTQFITGHLSTFGAVEITQDEYLLKLATAVRTPAVFNPDKKVSLDILF
ncbi:MAG: leucyl/phenylalanyl-tRNA--protein transferase [Alphaproteobacteria bacterium]|nr:leucyl/phenylalanyl-tRNA--protein transferase [Alphaproteobacteria bacterium]